MSIEWLNYKKIEVMNLDLILQDPNVYRFNISAVEYLKKHPYAKSGDILGNLRNDEMQVITRIIDEVHRGVVQLNDLNNLDAQQIVWLACLAMQAEGIPLTSSSIEDTLPLFLMHCTIESLSRKGLVVVNRDVFALSAPAAAELCRAVI